nr:hypothetical protein CFP56_68923 [Quercus suber]
MINKFLISYKKRKKETVTGMVASVFWAVCGGLQNSMVKMEFLFYLFLIMIFVVIRPNRPNGLIQPN